MLHVKLKGMTQRTQRKQIFCSFIYPGPPDGVKGSNPFFSEGHVKLKRKRCRPLCKFDLLGWVKGQTLKLCRSLKYILIVLSEFVVFSYDLSNTQDEIRCWRNGIYILWLTISPCDKNSGERPRAHEPCCLMFVF